MRYSFVVPRVINCIFLGSCRVIAHCRWGAWGPFQGSIARGSCGTQRRYRNAEKTWTYQNRVGSCSGTVTKCPRETDSQQRTMCKFNFYGILSITSYQAKSEDCTISPKHLQEMFAKADFSLLFPCNYSGCCCCIITFTGIQWVTDALSGLHNGLCF